MKLRTKFYIFLFILFNLIFIGWYFVIGPKVNEPGWEYNQGKNAIWIKHDWAEKEIPEVVIRDFVKKLVEHQIQYVFVHVGPVEGNGILPTARYAQATRFLEIARAESEEVVWLAWVGQLRSKLSLEQQTTRRNVVRAAVTLTQVTGFEGIHYDIEPIFSGDNYFVKLLEETREALGKEGFISVAADEWQSERLTRWISFVLNKHSRSYWNTAYYRQISGLVNQIVVMTYDTHFDQPWLYRWWVEQQLLYVDRAMDSLEANPTRVGLTELLIGIPSYEDEKESFNPIAENVKTGLEGVINGKNNLRMKTDNFVGVAIYPMWEMDEGEWYIWDRLWLGELSKDEIITNQLFEDFNP